MDREDMGVILQDLGGGGTSGGKGARRPELMAAFSRKIRRMGIGSRSSGA